MGTYRERRLARAEKLRGYAAGNAVKANVAGAAADQIMSMIPPGQPILVGHHSERRHRRDLARIESGIRKRVELGQKADEQMARAAEIEAQAARAIYDDDPDAIERLTEKLAALEAERERIKVKRAELRKAGGAELRAMTAYEREEVMRRAGAAQYRVTNLGGQITQTRQRLERLQREKVSGPRDRIIAARFSSSCEDCGATLEKGSLIRYNRQQGARCYPGCQTEEG